MKPRVRRFGAKALILLSVAVLMGTASGDDEKPALDLFLQEMGGSIPFPPQKILDKLDKDGVQLTSSIFPDGRSLERRFTSYAQPRSLLTFDYNNNLSDGNKKSNPVFMAYTPGNQQLQIISKNNLTGKFDFSLVTDYGPGKTPRLTPVVPPGLCYSCHQNHGPIFPVFPWSETTDNLPVLAKVKKGKEPFANYLLNGGLRFLVEGYLYDTKVAAANSELEHQQACRIGCGESLECKSDLIKIFLLGERLRPEKDALENFLTLEKKEEFLTAIQNEGHPSALVIPSFRLEDRKAGDPIRAGARFDPLERREPFDLLWPNSTVNSPDPQSALDLAKAQAVTNYNPLYNPRADLPAAASRLSSGDLFSVAEACFHVDFAKAHTDAQQIFDLSEDQVRSGLNSSAMAKLLSSNWPPTGDEILAAVLDVRDKKNSRPASETAPCKLPPSYGPDPTAQNQEILGDVFKAAEMARIGVTSFPHKDPRVLFQIYCNVCHGKANSPAPPLPLDDLEKLKNYRGTAGRTVKHLLAPPDRLMPPEGLIYPTEAERNEMIKAMEN